MATIFIKTYGCQMNARDSEQVARMLVARGHVVTGDEAAADVILLNTCSVRELAERKALGKMGSYRKARERRPELVLGFLGCMAQARGTALAGETPGVDLVVGTQKFHRVADYVDALLARVQPGPAGAVGGGREPIVDIAPEEGSQETIKDHLPGGRRAAAFVSIMQGCNMRCAFCIVPATRGRERHRAPADILAEVRALAAAGVKEVTLLGQIVNAYGRDALPREGGISPFVRLLEAVQAVDGIRRIRFTAPHPVGFRDDLIAAVGRLPKVAEHAHLPVQSGSDRILRAMRRGYSVAGYLRLVDRLRAARPGLALTTDIIVGFPGETAADYRATRDLVERVGFANAFIFKYSPRPGTAAAAFAEQVPEPVKEERNHDLLEVVGAFARREAAALVGATVEILCEGPSKNNPERLTGRTGTNRVVVFEGADRHIGEMFPVRIVETTGFTLYGDPVLWPE